MSGGREGGGGDKKSNVIPLPNLVIECIFINNMRQSSNKDDLSKIFMLQ